MDYVADYSDLAWAGRAFEVSYGRCGALGYQGSGDWAGSAEDFAQRVLAHGAG